MNSNSSTSQVSGFRLESDLLGQIAVPEDVLYGAQTMRALQNFPTQNQPILEDFPTLVTALLQVKKAAALANMQTGFLSKEIAEAIIHAVDGLLKNGWKGYFPIYYLHGGGGTSANMNANEVLANMAEEMLGGKRGEYKIVHPNDHVNLHQSTNDVYPTACHMAIISQWDSLSPALDRLEQAFESLVLKYGAQIRLARTCLQDAVEITFGDYFGGMSSQVKRMRDRLESAVSHLLAINLGGTICGRLEDVPEAYVEAVLENLKNVTGNARFSHASNLFDAAQNPDDLVSVSSTLDILARALIKISKDLRILSSGPQAGFGELRLPAVQPGSSIMPGKVNPVIPEYVIQACFRVIGNHAMCVAGLEHGELDLNIWESSMVFPILESIQLLELAIDTLIQKCLIGLEPIPEVNQHHVQTIIPRLTRLTRQHGYQAVNQVCRQASGDLEKLSQLLDEYFGAD